MGAYVLRRLGQALVVLWAAYTVTFLVLFLLPGDPVSGRGAPPPPPGGGPAPPPPDTGEVDQARIDALRAEHGFDQPVHVQYLEQFGRVLHGDLGHSVATGRPVVTMIAEALPLTVQLAVVAVVLAVLGGGGLALAATCSTRRWLRQALLSLPPLGVSVPTFWIGLVLVQFFAFQSPWFPPFGDQGAISLVLPAVTLAVPTGAVVAQVLAKSLLTTLEEPYVQTARAKGAGRVRIHLRHALRNASLPALTVVGLLLGNLLASAVVVETVFGRNGLGRITQSAVSVQDIPVVQGVVLFGALVVVVVNLAVDLVYPLLDPRVVTSQQTRQSRQTRRARPA